MLTVLIEPTKIEDFFKQLNHINTLPKILLLIAATIVPLLPFFKKFLAANTFNDLDHLFITKYESQINKFLVNIQNVFFFSIFYVGVATFYTFLIGEKLFTANIFFLKLLRICLYIFLITLILILLKICIETFKKKQLYPKATFWLLVINCATSLILYYLATTHYLYYGKWKFNTDAFNLIITPLFLFLVYKLATRPFKQQEGFFYIVKLISEEEIKEKTLAFRYSFDTDRMIFTEPDDENFEKPYVYDRSQNQYFQYIKTPKPINNENTED